MKPNILSAMFLIAVLTSVASAGTLEGKVSTGNSVVYVDTIPGKTFPAPSTATPPGASQVALG